jgi:radical SAM protein with 4Fe4S-binding SPASM domain
VALDMSSPKSVDEYRKLAELEASFAEPRLSTIDTVYFCGGGKNSFAVNAYGEMTICVTSQQERFDIRQSGLNDAWDNSLHEVRTRKRTRETKCIQCRIQSLCGMCPANAEMENGDKESPVDFYCHVAHLRAAVIGVEVSAHGECEFCASERETVLESARRIVSKEIDVDSWSGPQQILPVLNNMHREAGGCGSCGH